MPSHRRKDLSVVHQSAPGTEERGIERTLKYLRPTYLRWNNACRMGFGTWLSIRLAVGSSALSGQDK